MGKITHRILVVDDAQDLLEELGEIIKDIGHEPILLPNAEAALDYLATGAEVDLVLTDIRMPGKSGLDLLEEATAKFPATPVALMTGHADLHSTVDAIRGAAFDFISKPFGYAELEDLFRRLGDRSPSRHPFLLPNLEQGAEEYSVHVPNDLDAVTSCVKQWREHYKDVLNEAGYNPYSVALCLTEALNNAVLHGNLEVPSSLKDSLESWDAFDAAYRKQQSNAALMKRLVVFAWKVTPSELVVRIEDQGQGFDYSNAKSTADEATLLLEYGRGLLMIQKIMDSTVWSDEGRKIEMTLNFPNQDKE